MFHIGVLKKLHSLRELDLSNNLIKEFEQSFSDNITKINLANNMLHSLEWESISNLTNIIEFDLRNNNLTHINDSLVNKLQLGLNMHVKGNNICITN